MKKVINYAGNAAIRYSDAAKYFHLRQGYDAKFMQDLLKAAHPHKNFHDLNILDVGTGNGASLLAMITAGCDPQKLFGIEPNQHMRELAHQNGLQNIINSTAEKTLCPSKEFDLVTFFNSAHQMKDPDQIRGEINRVLKFVGKVALVAQKFDPNNIVVRELHRSCEQWKKEGLYPAYSDNGHEFISDPTSGINNTKTILNDYLDNYLKPANRTEIVGKSDAKYTKENFLGLLRSHLSFPLDPSPELIHKVDALHEQHCNKDDLTVTISYAAVAIIGNPMQRQFERCL